jgi:ribosome biogenesis GTPase
MVRSVDRGRFGVVMDEAMDREVVAMKARELGRKGVVVGDRVGLVGDLSGDPDQLARIVRVHPRSTQLRRTADDSDPVERVIVANADRLAIVCSLAEPAPQPRLIDRGLVAAYDARLSPLLILTKSDLAEPEPLLDRYAALVLDRVVLRRGDDLTPLRHELKDRSTVFVGSSGVGKSTLVNALVPDADRSTGVVNDVTGRGRHTSTSAVALALPGGGWVIDTPGIRSFGLGHVDLSRFMHAFPDLEPGTARCPRGCTHDNDECRLDDWVREGHADPRRLDSLRRLLASRGGEPDGDGA